jgi:aldose 1-epimerase
MIPLTGAQYEIAAAGYEAVVTELGAGLRQLTHEGQSLIGSFPADMIPPGGAGQLLAPWPNRIAAGRYTAGGTSHQLDLSEPGKGNAIHGLTRWDLWSPVRQAAGEVALRTTLLGRPGYPFCLEIEASYEVGEPGLRVRTTARNVGSQAAPYGLGFHPYLTAGLPSVDECELTVPAAQWLPIDARGIPSGPCQDVAGGEFDFRTARKIGVTRVDHAFTGLSRDFSGRAWVRLAGGGTEVSLWAGTGYRWLQVFTGDTLEEDRRRKSVAVEPMTCPPNAFGSGIDVLTLQPGDVVSHEWGVQVRRTGRP